MRCSAIAVVAGIALVVALALAPFTHLHADGAHHHVAEHNHDHEHGHRGGLVHAHLTAHQPAANTERDGWNTQSEDAVFSLDTMLTELGGTEVVLTALGVASGTIPDTEAQRRRWLGSPRAHSPPERQLILGRAPPA